MINSSKTSMMMFWARRMSQLKSPLTAKKYFAWYTVAKHGKVQCPVCRNTNMDCMELHHKNGNRKDNSVGNLSWRCCNCHASLHAERRRKAKRTGRRRRGMTRYLRA